MTSINFHNVQSIEVTETKIRESHNSDEKYYGARDIIIHTDEGTTRITVFTEDYENDIEVKNTLNLAS
jgi:hypothetical protein